MSVPSLLEACHADRHQVGFQQFFILVFVYLATRFQQRVAKESTPEAQVRVLRLLYTLYAVLGLITVSLVFFACTRQRFADTTDLGSHHIPPH